jgi:hypothetical protein
MIWRRTAVPVYCIANIGAFHGTNQSLGSAMSGDPDTT